MKVKYRNWSGEKTGELADCVANVLDGSDYDRGAVEAARATADNVASAFGRLLESLVKKRVIPLGEIGDIVGAYDVFEEVVE
jgi:hypothetical protein